MGATHPDGNAARISRNIYRLIEERGTTKAAVHRASGIARSTFYSKLDDRPNAFTVEELGSIAEHFGVTVVDLLKAA